VANRAWILPDWFGCVSAACEWANLSPTFAFVVPRTDHETRDAIVAGSARYNVQVLMVTTEENPDEAQRDWFRQERLHHMTDLRNQLLQVVRRQQPDFFWSLDSDILPAPTALQWAIPTLNHWEAVGMRTFMTVSGTDCTSRAQLVNGRLVNRQDCVGAFTVDCIMASKVMLPEAYAIDYEHHPQGEDIGWSIAARREGLTLGWTSNASCKHVMSPAFLHRVDPRLGW
jgi:hypothetical protein